nr:T9SS type A sorting domain-containing protein [Chitinophagales bacterium]
SGNYTFNGFASFSLGWTETQNFLIKEGEAKEWALTVEDELGCSGQKQEAIICTKTPIELLDFSGLALENGNQISWATATETNSAYFILERSIGYYRLLEIDVNNKTSIVASIFVTRTQTNLPLLQNLGNSAYQIQTWGEASFELYNASGKVLVSKHQTQPTKTQMSLNQYGAGIYYLQITCNGYKTIHKLVAY